MRVCAYFGGIGCAVERVVNAMRAGGGCIGILGLKLFGRSDS